MITYTRECPNCNGIIEYTNKGSWYNAKANNSKCTTCYRANISKTLKNKIKNGEFKPYIRTGNEIKKEKFSRKCPDCNYPIYYSSEKSLKNAIGNNTICNSCSTIKHKKGTAFNPTDDSVKQMRASKAGFSSWEEYVEKYPKKQFYKREVWKYTYRQSLESLNNFDKRGRCGVDGAYQIDHIVSINEGWEKNIPAKVIGDISNLQMIPWKKNRTKGVKSK